MPGYGFIIRKSIGQEDGPQFSSLVEKIKADEDSSIFTKLRGRLNHTRQIIKEGFKGTVDGLKERVKAKMKEKIKHKVKEKMAKSQ